MGVDQRMMFSHFSESLVIEISGCGIPEPSFGVYEAATIVYGENMGCGFAVCFV